MPPLHTSGSNMAKQTSLKAFKRPNATDEGEPSDEDEPVIGYLKP